jgi:hypothetical protein
MCDAPWGYRPVPGRLITVPPVERKVR